MSNTTPNSSIPDVKAPWRLGGHGAWKDLMIHDKWGVAILAVRDYADNTEREKAIIGNMASAAPDLYAALHSLTCWDESLIDAVFSGEEREIWREHLDRASVALAKARGEAGNQP
jgi:hypothetical protein